MLNPKIEEKALKLLFGGLISTFYALADINSNANTNEELDLVREGTVSAFSRRALLFGRLLTPDSRLLDANQLPQTDPSGNGDPAMWLNAFAGFASILALTAAICSLATALTFARVLAFAAVVSGLTSALALTIVLAFTRVFSCVGIDEIVNGSACYVGSARSIRAHCNGTGEEPGNGRSSDNRFRWFHGTISF
jgi:hypothetical protein